MTATDTLVEELWFSPVDRDAAFGEAEESLAVKLAEVDGLKTFPVVAQKAIALLSHKEFDVGQVTESIKADPSIAAGVLRMANSAFFAGTKAVSSIETALVRLGSRSVLEVVAAVATMDLFPDSGGVGKQVRDHCVATAAIVQYLAREFAAEHREGIFLCGLMHDIGKMLLIESGEIDYVVEGIDTSTPDRSHGEEQSLLGYDHAVLGGHVLFRWKLPPPIPKVVAWHHQPTRAYEDPEVRPLVALLRIADQLDPMLRAAPEDATGSVEKICNGLDSNKVWMSPDDFLTRWDALLDCRNAALALFGG
ncbi:MAG: HDOD domain-containing protein [Myxococcota bacterium]|nr:HDOD domain-containing protein [Myxococcota bacterium]